MNCDECGKKQKMNSDLVLVQLQKNEVRIGFPDMSQPKITNNSIKVIKVV